MSPAFEGMSICSYGFIHCIHVLVHVIIVCVEAMYSLSLEKEEVACLMINS